MTNQIHGVGISESNSSIDDFLEILSKQTGISYEQSVGTIPLFFIRIFIITLSVDVNMDDSQLRGVTHQALNPASDQTSIMDILSLMDMPSDFDTTNLTNNNFDSNNSMDVDQDVADWLNSIQSSTSKQEFNGNRMHQPSPIISDPILMSAAMNSPSTSSNALQTQSMFVSDDAEMCSSSFWGN